MMMMWAPRPLTADLPIPHASRLSKADTLLAQQTGQSGISFWHGLDINFTGQSLL